MNNNHVLVSDQPKDIPVDPPQVDPAQSQFDAFRASTRTALPEGLRDQWDRSDNVFLNWAFQTWKVSLQNLQTGLINILSMCLHQMIQDRTPAPVQATHISRPEPCPQNVLQQGQPQPAAPQAEPINQAARPYRKLNQLRQIPDYDGAFRNDAAERWLRKVDQYFWYERNLAGLEANEFQKVALCKSKLIKVAGEWLISQEEKVASGFEAPIDTMDRLKQWIRKNFREI